MVRVARLSSFRDRWMVTLEVLNTPLDSLLLVAKSIPFPIALIRKRRVDL